jgi:deoxyribodipyrimidine photo-lyase
MHLVWYRQDLRIQDHSALFHATSENKTVALVILSPSQWKAHNESPTKFNLYLKQLKILQEQLNLKNIALHCIHTETWADIPNALYEFCNNYQITDIHFHTEVGVNEQTRDAKTATALYALDIQVHEYQDRTIFPLGSIRNQSGQPYQVFSAFKKKCMEQLLIGQFSQPYLDIQIQEKPTLFEQLNTDLTSFESLYSKQHQQIDALWPSGEDYAQQQLNEFIEDHLEYYHLERDLPHLNGTSQISTYLNLGILSIRQCLAALFAESDQHVVLRHQGQEIWLNELLWREFYLHLMHDHPSLSKHQPFKKNTLNIPWRDAPEDLTAWQSGQTGIPIVDAGMRQMLATGWMHNRVRMICAMFLTKNLLIDWRLGEAWFMQNLIDGDLAANNGGWQWCASTGTDSAPYFRIFNPVSQSQKFDPEGAYIREWLPELAHLPTREIHNPYAKPTQTAFDYPHPIVDLKQSRLRAIETFKNYT